MRRLGVEKSAVWSTDTLRIITFLQSTESRIKLQNGSGGYKKYSLKECDKGAKHHLFSYLLY